MTFNIQSISSKFADFNELIALFHVNKCAPDIICLQELWQFPSVANFSLPGYGPLISKLRAGTARGGGVGFFIKERIQFKILPVYSTFVDKIYESLFIEVAMSNKSKIVIGNIYRPGSIHPSLSPLEQFNQFAEIFSNTLSTLTESGVVFHLAGDFNIDLIKCNSNLRSAEFMDLLFSFGLLQIVTKPTRCTDNSASLIDHFITNQCAPVFTTIILTSKISDHFPVICFPFSKMPTEKPKSFTSRNFSHENMVKFEDSISAIDWNFVRDETDVQSSYNVFFDLFHNLYSLQFPLKTIRFNQNVHCLEPWMSSAILISRSRKLKLASLSARNPDVVSGNAYKTYRNLYNTVLRAAKKKYFEVKLLENQNNLKKTWDILRTAINSGGQKREPISELFVDGINYTDPSSISTVLNQFFTTAPQKIVDDLPPVSSPPVVYFDNPVSFSFSSTMVTQAEIVEATSQLLPKKSEDFNGLSMFFIKKFIHVLSVPLLHLISKSLETGLIPTQLKIAKVIPIFKSGDALTMQKHFIYV